MSVASIFSRPLRDVARTGILIGALGLIAGCGILPKQSSVSLYRPEPVIANDATWSRVDWQLRIARPYADAAHDSERILVRPQAGELQVYKGAAWTQPAPDIVHDTLLRAFADSGRFAGISRRGESVAPRYELLLDLRRFESDYDGGAAPAARIELGARLVRVEDQSIVASRVFIANVPAGDTAVASVNHAFERGLGEMSSQMIGWVLTETAAAR